MLNYVWLALLFLGIGAALSTDIINQSSNKYRNNESLPAEIIFNTALNPEKDSTYDVQIKVPAKNYNSFYNDYIREDIIFPAKVTFNDAGKKRVFYVKFVDSPPAVWKEMAGTSGKEDDLSGTLSSFTQISDTTISTGLIFEEVSFLGLRKVTNSALDYAGTAVEISLGLIGIMALWLGVMKVAEEAGLIRIIAVGLRPLTKKLFPDIPSEHPAMGSMIMNISANMLGLGNAATPFGLKAMEELNTLNPDKNTATNSMITFLAINTAGMTLIPASAIAIRAASGSTDPALIIGTSLFGSTCATIVGLTAARVLGNFPLKFGNFGSWIKRNIKGILVTSVILALIIILIFSGALNSLSPDVFKGIIQVVSTIAIPFLILFFIGFGAIKRVKVYEKFVEGAKEGFNVAVRIIPFLVAMLVAIGIFRAGGAMEWLVYILKPATDFIGMPAEALPMALMRPLSGSGSLGIMAEIMAVHGPDSFLGIMVSTFYGSTETTFYVLAVYFGSVNIRNTRHALPAGLLADVAGILGAVFIVKLLYGV